MGFLDRLVGTSRPDADVPARPADEVRAALLAVAADGRPYSVTEDADGRLTARWRVEEPAWRTYFTERGVDRTVEVEMRLEEDAHEVRHVTKELEVTTEAGALRVSREASMSRGNSRTVSKRWTVGGSGEGAQETFSFDSADLTRALERACLEQGWVWKGVVGKL